MKNINKNTILKCLLILVLLYNAIIVIIIKIKTENNGEITSLSNKDKNYITQMEKEARKLELSNELLKIYSDIYVQ